MAAKKELTKRERMRKLRLILGVEYILVGLLTYFLLDGIKSVGAFAIVALIIEGFLFFYDLPETRKTVMLRYWMPAICLLITVLVFGL